VWLELVVADVGGCYLVETTRTPPSDISCCHVGCMRCLLCETPPNGMVEVEGEGDCRVGMEVTRQWDGQKFRTKMPRRRIGKRDMRNRKAFLPITYVRIHGIEVDLPE